MFREIYDQRERLDLEGDTNAVLGWWPRNYINVNQSTKHIVNYSTKTPTIRFEYTN